MRRLLAFACLALTAVAVACGGGDDPTAPSTPNDPARAPAGAPPSLAYAEHPSGMWINTDKNDYAPGDRVIFTGGGWQPGDTLDIHLTNDSTHAEQQWTIAVDPGGAFTDSTYLVDVADLNLAFTLTATSRANPEQTLTVTFTDGTLSLTAPVLVPGFQSFPYSSGNLTFTARNANTGNPAGNHTNVRVSIRVAGNLNPSPPALQRTLTVAATLLPNPPNPTASVNWDGNDGSANPLAEGLYGARVFSNETAEPNNSSIQIVVDRTAPTISASPAPTVSPNQATPGPPGVPVTFTATAVDPVVAGVNANNYRVASAEYRIDNGAWLAMTAADGNFNSATEAATATIAAGTVAGLSSGSHLVCVRASDGAGSRSSDLLAGNANCATLTIAVADNVPPTVTNVSASPNPGNTGSATLTATATDALSNITGAEYRVDAGSWTAMAAQDGSFNSNSEVVTAGLSGIPEGSHQVCVRATDAANNTSDGTDCITLVVDQTAPSVNNVAAVPNPGNTGNAVLTASATDLLTNVTGAEYKIGAGSWTAMDAQDGAFDSKTEALTVNLTGVPEGENQVCVRATDAAGNTSAGTGAACITLIVDQTPPVVSNVSALPNPVSSGAVTVTATATDALTKVLSGDYNIDGGSWLSMAAADGAFDAKAEGLTATIPAATIAGLSEGEHDVCVRATDEVGNTSAGTGGDCIKLVVDRTPPAISSFQVMPNPVPVNTAFAISFNLSDLLSNIAGAAYSIDTGSGQTWYQINSPNDGAFDETSESFSVQLPPRSTPDVIEVCVRGSDAAGNTNQPYNAVTNPPSPIQCLLVAIYDPTAGFVTGGGWIESPPNAYAANPSLTGKATFGFVSKYLKGANKPTGNTEFQFHVASFNFSSTTYDWLVVAGYRAQYKGTGTVNGQGNYGFLLTAIDGGLGGPGYDAFRIKIWNVASGAIVYDNQLGQSDTGDATTQIAGGSIMIHVPKK